MIAPPEGHYDTPHFHNLKREMFEDMILDLVREENPGADFFPDNPTNQKGSDILLTRRNGKRVFIECKGRQDWFGGSELREAVNKFLSGEMSNWANVFCVITSGKPRDDTKEAILQAQKDCESHGIKFKCEVRKGLWRRLREYPQIVQCHLDQFWADKSRVWCESRFAEYREKVRREQPEKVFSSEGEYRFDYGYFTLEFYLPDAHRFNASALIRFKTDGLESALITLGNDEVLNSLDESRWQDGRPFLATECEGGGHAQIGNVRILLTDELFIKLAQQVRLVREKWLEGTATRNRNLEAEGYQHIEEDRIKLGRIQADMWRCMIRFAMKHDFRKGSSPWHIFDVSPSQINIYTKEQTSEIDPGYHLGLSTWPFVSASTGGNKDVDLIWNPSHSVKQGGLARGRRGFWGCETAVTWLRDEFLPMLIDLHWANDTRTPVQRLFGRSLESYRPKVDKFFYVQKAKDWSNIQVLDWDSLSVMLSDLQRHYSLRIEGSFPGAHVQAADDALLLVLKSAIDPYCGYIASNAELTARDQKGDLLRELEQRLKGFYRASSGYVLDCRLRAVLDALGEREDNSLNSSEYQQVAEKLNPLARSAALYNRLLAHRSAVSEIYPV